MKRNIPIFNPPQHSNPKKIVSERMYSKSKGIVRSQLGKLRDTIFSFRCDNPKTDFYINFTMNRSIPIFNPLQHPNPNQKKNVSAQQYKYIFQQIDYLLKCIILMKIRTAKHVKQKKYFWLTKNIIHLYCIPPPYP